MVDTRSKASKRRDWDKRKVVKDLPFEQDNSPTLSSGDNSMDRPRVSQFVTAKLFGEYAQVGSGDNYLGPMRKGEGIRPAT